VQAADAPASYAAAPHAPEASARPAERPTAVSDAPVPAPGLAPIAAQEAPTADPTEAPVGQPGPAPAADPNEPVVNGHPETQPAANTHPPAQNGHPAEGGHHAQGNGHPAGQNGHPGPNGHPAQGNGQPNLAGQCTAPQLRRFIKSRPYVPMHELRRRFGINGGDDDVCPIELEPGRIYVGLPPREGSLLGELLRAGEIGYELSMDPRSPIVVGVYPMRPVPRS
jgi:hypothetical protein